MMREVQRDYYRERLLALRARLTGEVRAAVDTVADKGGAPDEISHVPTHAADRDSEGLDRDIALEANREKMLDGIDRSFERIHDGSYGRCEDCGCEIPSVRLEALPYAVRCVECEEKQEEEG
jgi:RNA polymerase-binding protein DksA